MLIITDDDDNEDYTKGVENDNNDNIIRTRLLSISGLAFLSLLCLLIWTIFEALILNK